MPSSALLKGEIRWEHQSLWNLLLFTLKLHWAKTKPLFFLPRRAVQGCQELPGVPIAWILAQACTVEDILESPLSRLLNS